MGLVYTVAGKGGITKKDLQRVATEHDFTWTDKEIADMIHCFDSDGDGKVSIPSSFKKKNNFLQLFSSY